MADKEYVDRVALIKAICECTAETWGKGLGRSWWSHSVQLKDNMVRCINNQTAADVVEVVRCKDCKFWRAMDDGFSFHNRGRTDGECEMLFERHYSERHLTGGEHFCSYGERKEDNR